MAASAWLFPVAGAVIGLLAGMVYFIATALGMAHTVAAWITIGATILLTGGLHEDGLADMADGMAYGRSREEKLSIMRDSRIGSFGVLALITILAIRASALASCGNAFTALSVLIAAAMGSRACMVVLMHYLPPARPDGLAAMAGSPNARNARAAMWLGLLPLVFFGFNPLLVGACMLMLACYAAGQTAKKHFGGITGDVLGAAQQVSEALLLALLAH